MSLLQLARDLLRDLVALLFVVLPFGVNSQHETDEVTPGTDASAPHQPLSAAAGDRDHVAGGDHLCWRLSLLRRVWNDARKTLLP